jgi:hypothetical protein
MRLFRSPRLQVRASLRHCHHVLHAMRSYLANTMSAVVYWKKQAWEGDASVRTDLVPRCERIMQQSVRAGTFVDEDDDSGSTASSTKRSICVLHVAVPALPRDALLEVQLMALPSAPELPVTSFQPPPSPSLPPSLSIRTHATLVRRLFASVWSAWSCQRPHAEPAAEASLMEAVSIMIKDVEAAMNQAALRSEPCHVQECSEREAWMMPATFHIFVFAVHVRC